jgi:hypothetical protein
VTLRVLPSRDKIGFDRAMGCGTTRGPGATGR